MAVNALAAQQCTVAGITPTRTAMAVGPGDTYTFPNDGRVVLSFLKTGAGAATVTILTGGTAGGLAIADVTVTVGATTGDVMVGPLNPLYFNDPATGLVTFSTDEATAISVAVIHLS